jgi:cytochrome c oxidase subunit 3
MPDDLPRRDAPADPPASVRRTPLVPNGVLAMLIFVAVEAMFFSGLISAFLILKSSVSPTMWPPPHQPRLPVEATAFNTAALIASGVLFWVAAHLFKKDRARAFVPFLLATALGTFFVLFQGYEWQALIREGLTLQSSSHGAFFYLIVGAHALHAIGALFVLGWLCLRLWRGRLVQREVWAVQVLWTFVVGIWPVIYALVYLA